MTSADPAVGADPARGGEAGGGEAGGGEAGGRPAARPSPNIWNHPEVYELENLGLDQAGRIEAAMRDIHDWAGGHVLDIGCGSGFHLPRWATTATRVTGVEPHPPLVAAALARVAGLDPVLASRISVKQGVAQALPMASWDESGGRGGGVDVAHARWAYFFGPGCEPGLAELARVIRPGGTAFVIDNDPTRSTFGSWFRWAFPEWDGMALERFWRRQGFRRIGLDVEWAFADRATFERVVGIEFRPEIVERILDAHPGTGVDYAVNLWWRRY